jgi:hypothetical protein
VLQQFGKLAISRAFAIELVLLLALSGYYRDLNKDRKEKRGADNNKRKRIKKENSL